MILCSHCPNLSLYSLTLCYGKCDAFQCMELKHYVSDISLLSSRIGSSIYLFRSSFPPLSFVIYYFQSTFILLFWLKEYYFHRKTSDVSFLIRINTYFYMLQILRCSISFFSITLYSSNSGLVWYFVNISSLLLVAWWLIPWIENVTYIHNCYVTLVFVLRVIGQLWSIWCFLLIHLPFLVKMIDLQCVIIFIMAWE